MLQQTLKIKLENFCIKNIVINMYLFINKQWFYRCIEKNIDANKIKLKYFVAMSLR